MLLLLFGVGLAVLSALMVAVIVTLCRGGTRSIKKDHLFIILTHVLFPVFGLLLAILVVVMRFRE